jgi:hypothetical protein
MPEPPTRSQQPQQAAQPQVDQLCDPPANIPPTMLRHVQYLQGNLGIHQTNGLATGALVQPMSQQQFQMLQQQGVFIQVPPPPPLLPAQQDHRYQQQGSVDAQPALTGGLVPGGGPVMNTDNAEGGADFGSANADPDQWPMYHGGGSMDEVGVEVGILYFCRICFRFFVL